MYFSYTFELTNTTSYHILYFSLIRAHIFNFIKSFSWVNVLELAYQSLTKAY